MSRAMIPSGIEWIGEIPEGWEVVKVKRRYKFQTGWTPPTGKDESYFGDNLWANISDLGKKVIFDTAKRISNLAIKQSNIELSKKDELMFSFKLSIGAVSFCGTDMYTNEAIATFKKGNNSLHYLYFASPIFITANANENIYGAKLLNQQLIQNAFLALPPLSEQQAIADYLDRKCELIDSTIEKQKTAIEKLKLYKQSVITEAVTKGLDPTVPMKPSGIEWIGDIPKDWEVKKTKYLATLKTGITPSSNALEYFDGDFDWFTPSDFSDEIILHTSSRKVSKRAIEEKVVPLFPTNSILMIGIGATTGKIGFTINDSSSNQQITAIIIKKYQCPKYYLFLFLSMVSVLKSIALYTTLPILNNETISQFYLITPPLPEQQAIADYLDQKCFQIDQAIELKQKLIEKLSNYKKSLIYECVTGKREVKTV